MDKMEESSKNDRSTRDPRKNFMHRWRAKGHDGSVPGGIGHDERDVPSPSDSMWDASSVQSPDWMKSPNSGTSHSPQTTDDSSPLSRSDVSPRERQGPSGKSSDGNPQGSGSDYESSSLERSRKNLEKTLAATQQSTEAASDVAISRDVEGDIDGRKVHMLPTSQYSGGSTGSSAVPSPLPGVGPQPFPIVDLAGLHVVTVTNAVSRVVISDNVGRQEMVTLPRPLPSILCSQSARNGAVSSWEPPLSLPCFPHVSVSIDKVLNPAHMATAVGRSQRPSNDYLQSAPAQRSGGESRGKPGSSRNDTYKMMPSEGETSRPLEGTAGGGGGGFPHSLKPNIHLTQRSAEIYNFEDTIPAKSEPFEGYRPSHRSKYTIQDGAVRKQVSTPPTRSQETSVPSSSVMASPRYHPYHVESPPQTSPGGSRGSAEGGPRDSRPGPGSSSDQDQQPSSSGEVMQGVSEGMRGGMEGMRAMWDVKDEGDELMRQVDSTRAEARMCQVCGDLSAGFHCGAHVCEACKKFFVRCIRQETGIKFVCHRKQRCIVTKETRTQCQYCRFQKCINLGMYKPGGTNISTEIGHIPCKVCGAPSSGYHFGAITCEGCKGFFRRTIKERDHMKYHCAKNGNCAITVATRNMCKFCRYQKCIDVGMNPSGSRIGRQPNSIRHATLVQLQQIKTQKGLPLNMEIPVTRIKLEPGLEFGYVEPSTPMDTDSAATSSMEQAIGRSEPSGFSPSGLEDDTKCLPGDIDATRRSEFPGRHGSHTSYDSGTVQGISDDSSDLSVDHELGEVSLIHDASPRTAAEETSAQINSQLTADIARTLSSVIAQPEPHNPLLNTMQLLSEHGSHFDPRVPMTSTHRHSVDGVQQSPVGLASGKPAGQEHSRSMSLDQPPRFQGLEFNSAFQKSTPDIQPEVFEQVLHQMSSAALHPSDHHHLELGQGKFELQDSRTHLFDHTRVQLEQAHIDASSLHRLDDIRLQPLEPVGHDHGHHLALHAPQVSRLSLDPSQDHVSKYLANELRTTGNQLVMKDSQKHGYEAVRAGYQVSYNRQQSTESIQDSVFSPAESCGSSQSMLSTLHTDLGDAGLTDSQRMSLYQRSRSMPTVHESETVDQRDPVYQGGQTGIPTTVHVYPKGKNLSVSTQHLPPAQGSQTPSQAPTSPTKARASISHSGSLDVDPSSQGGPSASEGGTEQATDQPSGEPRQEEQVCSRRSSCSQSNPISPEKVAEAMASAMEDLSPIRKRGGIVLTRSMTMRTIWQAMMAQFQQSALSILQFAKKVPGFSRFPGNKQIEYVQENMFPIVMSQLALDYDLVSKRINYFNFTDEERDIIFDNFPSFRILPDSFHSLGRKIKENNFTEVEVAFLCGLIMVCEGEDSTAIEGLTFGLQKYIKDTYKTPNNKFGQILMMMAEFKKLNEVHQNSVLEIMSDPVRYQGIEFPQLFSEVFVNSNH